MTTGAVLPALVLLLLSPVFFGESGSRKDALRLTAAIAATQLADLLGPFEVSSTSATESVDPEVENALCATLSIPGGEARGATAVYRDGGLACFDSTLPTLTQPAVLGFAQTLDQRMSAAGVSTLEIPSRDGVNLIIGRKLDAPHAMVIFVTSQAALSDLLMVSAANNFVSIVLLNRDGQVLADLNHDSGTTKWLTRAVEQTVPGTSMKLQLLDRSKGYFGLGSDRLVALLLELLAISSVALLAVVLIDRNVIRWIDYLRRIADAHSRERFSVRFRREKDAPLECAVLGTELNEMADNASRQLDNLQNAAAEKSKLVHELHHRVKNNFQVIESLLNLQKKTLPEAQHDDIRFIEDHVRSMVVADRIAFNTMEGAQVPLQKLLSDVVDGLWRAATAVPNQVMLDMALDDIHLTLDHSIALSLFLAAILPPYIKKSASDRPLKISATQDGQTMILEISGISPPYEEPPFLIQRLIEAYFTQLGIEETPLAGPTFSIAIPLKN